MMSHYRSMAGVLVALLVLSALFGGDMRAQNHRQDLWNKVKEAEANGLPQTAGEHLRAIYASALADGAWAEAMRALTKRIVSDSVVKGNKPEDKILMLQEELGAAPPKMQPVLRLLLARWYWHYFQRNRWRFMQRSRTEGLAETDFTTWDLPRLFQEISGLYQSVLKEEDLLVQLPVEDFAGFLEKGELDPVLRPTLFEFAAFEALDFYTSGEQAGAQPEDAFEIQADSEALAAAEAFLKYRPETTDTASAKYLVLQIFSRLLTRHADDGRRDAFVDADLARLAYVRQTAVGEEGAARYRERLEEIIRLDLRSEVAAQARYLLGKELFDAGDNLPAHRLAAEGAKAWPGTRGGDNCRGLLASIEEQAYGLTAEQSLLPGRPGRMKLGYKNVRSVTLRLIREDFHAYLEDARNRNLNWMSDEQITAILKRKAVAEWTIQLEPTLDFKNREILVDLPPLTAGFYLVLASHRGDFGLQDNKIQYCRFWGSQLAVGCRGRAGKFEGHVLDADTGQPRPGVDVALHLHNYSQRGYQLQSTARTDKEGYFVIAAPSQSGQSVLLARDANGQEVAEPQLHLPYYRPDEAYQRTVFFTDRALYRPGQMVHFKGLCLDVGPEEGRYRVLPGRRVAAALRDANGQEITRQEFITNDYGSFAGTFTAPADRLTGQWSLVAEGPQGTATFRVEEYKRPKFKVALETPKTEFRLDGPVEIGGEAMAYTGAPIDGARVRYRVTRQVSLPPWCLFWWGWRGWNMSSQEIAHGTLQTGTDGKFKVPFVARPDRAIQKEAEPVFTFRVEVDVTDSSGETRSGRAQVRLGYTAMEASLSAAGWQDGDKPAVVDISTFTLDGQRIPASGTLRIFELDGPSRPVPAEMIGETSLRERQAVGDTPEKGFAETADWEKWPAGKQVAQSEFTTGVEGERGCRLEFRLPPGAYRAVLASRDAFGSPVQSRLQFLVLQPDRSRFTVPLPHFWSAPQTVLEVGQTFEALWGTGYDRGPLLVEVFKDFQKLQHYWLPAERTQSALRIPVTEALRGGFTVVTTLVKENRLYRNQTRVLVPWSDKRLALSWKTFRDKLQPGQEEKWTLQVAGPDAAARAAELAATLYDASLDQYYPHRWAALGGFFKLDRTHLADAYTNGIQHLNTWRDQLNHHPGYSSDRYPHFPSELVEDLFGYQYFRESSRSRDGGAMPPPAPMPGKPMAMSKAAPMEEGLRAEAAPVGEKMELADTTPPEPPEVNLDVVAARTNLQETAFFYPQLLAGPDGIVELEFKMPEALTTWRFLGLAHTPAMESGLLEGETVTRKELMVQPNPPRFLREGDVLEFTVKVTNLGEAEAAGKVRLGFSDPETEAPLDASLHNEDNERTFTIPAGESRSFSWRLEVPDGLGVVAFKAVGATAKFSDGEAGLLPVLSRRLPVQEAIPLWISQAGRKEFQFDKLLHAGESATLRHTSLTVQMASNPAWYAVQALPYLMEFPYECSEQVFNRLYANALAKHVADSDPKIRRVFDLWRGTDALESNLQKNEDLKSVLLQESPWVLQAKAESQAKQNVGLLFEDNRMRQELKQAVAKLEGMRLGDGSWPWFPGGRGNLFITLYIVTGMGRLRHLGVQGVVGDLPLRSLDYLDHWLVGLHERILKDKVEHLNHLTPLIAQYLYGRSFYLADRPPSGDTKPAVDFFLGQGARHWLELDSRQSQAQLALALDRWNDRETARKIMRSMKERSQRTEEMGRYWSEMELSWWWYRAPIETQALMIEAFDEVMQDAAAVEECKIWLLKQKQTRDWKTTKATADAVYGLLRRGAGLLADSRPVTVSLAGQPVQPEKVEAGTGFYEVRFGPDRIVPEMGRVTVEKAGPGIAWGGVHWQYLEDISRITPHQQNPLRLKKSLFVQRDTAKGPVIEPVGGPLRVGDLVRVRIELRTDRDMEYVHLKDHRGSGLEPVNVLSSYKYQDGLAYYESTRDSATHFFIDYLPKGTYVFEYSVRVVHRGTYQNGLAHIECMYAPEFNSHSDSVQLEVQ